MSMSITDAITHLQIATLVLEYAKADAFHRANSLEAEATPEALQFIMSKLDAATRAADVAVAILQEPRLAATLSRAA
jgi:hypothetical protein